MPQEDGLCGDGPAPTGGPAASNGPLFVGAVVELDDEVWPALLGWPCSHGTVTSVGVHHVDVKFEIDGQPASPASDDEQLAHELASKDNALHNPSSTKQTTSSDSIIRVLAPVNGRTPLRIIDDDRGRNKVIDRAIDGTTPYEIMGVARNVSQYDLYMKYKDLVYLLTKDGIEDEDYPGGLYEGAELALISVKEAYRQLHHAFCS